MPRISARQRLCLRPLSAELIHSVARRVFPKRNDYGVDPGLFEELVPDLDQLGVRTAGHLKRILTKHRRALLRDDRSRLAPWEERMFSEMFGAEFVRDAVRRQYWFALPAMIWNAMDSEFGSEVVERIRPVVTKDESVSTADS
ncbi:hypothetical protein FVQ98_18720 [Ottowia sp. GY511]|uniref:Asparagine synthetase domain-containing protein n=1 Tax=Ottowia flava TaxID=2675430 RepID=A0ABW4KR78_9BURK|nr:hypothetical protein [Ottowia sp. GY511]TXK22014.1 hypothetical protein FVQ98_18720 [Ottowia sp. GY511]